MIEIIITSAHFIYTIIYYCFYFSCKIGEFLVTSLPRILEPSISYLYEGLIIILESFSTFCQDIALFLPCIIQMVSNLVELIERILSTDLYNIINVKEILLLAIVTVLKSIVDCMLSVVTGILQIFVFLKRVIVLFGSGVWFSITFIPLLIVYLVTLAIYYVGRLFEEAIDSVWTCIWATKVLLKDIYQFITDVPWESAIGLVVFASMVYLFTQFNITICTYIYRLFQSIINIYPRNSRPNRRRIDNSLVNQRPAIGTRTLTRSRPQIRSELNSPRPNKSETVTDDRCCVICQERIKCILLLPCRHVCMCNECNIRLELYHNTCPICRNDIESSMKIFV